MHSIAMLEKRIKVECSQITYALLLARLKKSLLTSVNVHLREEVTAIELKLTLS